MPEYIEREAANEALRECVRVYPNSFYNGIEVARTAIRKLPTVDAVEVVRCKDCKHRPFPDKTYGFVDAPDSICPCHNSDDSYYSWIPDDNFFCADGERKEDKA